ncbi:hypothetical protein JZ751_001159 [Albula glossodonta]|uniref:Uncharacterized protein n=1 Tax=Albula glossodonta TaxID=121402 RepID=A0A8T2PSZ3_9TELE|nr:hypothetical protein JZ751_001159 [Albula glossodonta]
MGKMWSYVKLRRYCLCLRLPAGYYLPLPLPPRLPIPMVTSRVGPRGLEAEDLPDRPRPAWKAVWAAYTTVFIPLSSSLYSSKALKFFLWLKQMKELEQEKDILLAGLEVVERAQEWYQNQIQREVTEKSERITQLEQEKSALLKQLFDAHARSTHESSTLDSTFI